MKDPVRLLSGGSPDVQDVLRSANGDAPLRAQLDHLASRLAPTVAAPASGALLPWLLAGGALLGAAGVFVLAREQPRQPAATSVRTEPPPPQQPAPEVPAVAITADPVPEPAPSPTKKAPEPPRMVAAPGPARQAPPPPPVPRELELLTSAQAALHANDFAGALALAERHARLYAAGTFAEEREAIAIEALQRLGQRDRARVRLTAFTTEYPHSGYRARLERMVRE